MEVDTITTLRMTHITIVPWLISRYSNGDCSHETPMEAPSYYHINVVLYAYIKCSSPMLPYMEGAMLLAMIS